MDIEHKEDPQSVLKMYVYSSQHVTWRYSHDVLLKKAQQLLPERTSSDRISIFAR